MRINWLWVFVIMSLLLSVITITMVYIFTKHDFKLAHPKYAFYSSREESRLFNPKSDLESIGYKRTEIQKMDWDLLWSHEYPFPKLSDVLRDLKPNQKVNHWPGISSIANKLELSTSKDFAFVPKSFRIPKDLEELQDYAALHKNKKFVQKHISHRNVSIVEPESLNKGSGSSIFVQEFIQDPYLIDGYKFDLGVLVLLTSVNPLRLYIFDEVVLRFCKSKYVDYADKDSYVVRKNYLGIEAIPSLQEFHQSAKHSLDSYLRSKKRNPNLIWTQIENSIREVFLKRESRIIEALEEKFSESHYENFFELFKFDFLVTNGEDLKVWMMEANMSPIYSPEDIMSNTLSVVLKHTGVEVNSAPMDPLVCMENHCNSEKAQCEGKCELCTKCLKGRKEVSVKSAYRENQSELRRFERIFPKPITYDFNLEKELKTLNSDMNKFMTSWYFEKCRSESKWCQ